MNVVNLSVKGVKLFEFPKYEDARGVLTVANLESEIPFTVLRYFLVYNVPENKIRGEHAHKEGHQFLVCAAGSCTVLVDDGYNKEEVLLDQPNKGLYLPPKIWGVQHSYSINSCLLVLASHSYDKADYIGDYEEFKKIVS